jgi:putative ABC transport system ATP-binding protein
VEAFSVLENVVLASWLATGKQAGEKAKSLLKQLDLEDQMHKLTSQLSIGHSKEFLLQEL